MDLKTNAFEYNCFLSYFLFGSLLSQDIIISFCIRLTNAFCMIIVSYGSFNRLQCLSVLQTKCRFLACSCLNGSPCLVLGSCSVLGILGEVLAASAQSQRQSYTYYQHQTKTFCSYFIHCINQLLYAHFLHLPIHNLCQFWLYNTIKFALFLFIHIYISILCPTFDALAFILGYHNSFL